MLEYFLRHRRDVVTRRTLFELRKARERAHILEGYAIALANLDEVIALIRAAASPAEARAGLMARPWPPGAVTGMLDRAGAEQTRPEELEAGVRQIARSIAAKSPLAIRGTKEVLNYSRDHSIADGLNFVATWNAATLLSGDLKECMQAQMEKRAPQFAD